MSRTPHDTNDVDRFAAEAEHDDGMTWNQRSKYTSSDGVQLSDVGDPTDESYSIAQQKGKVRKRPRIPRKKQAVTKTRDRAVIAKIEQSRRTSPLLKLPTEVLQKILKYIVGGRLIHVEYKERDDPNDLLLLVSDTGSKDGAFRSAFCNAKQSEKEVYDEANAGYEKLPPEQLPEYYVASWKQRHNYCYCSAGMGDFITPETGHSEHKVDLRAMGTCRQLYEECNILLWGTNTFSFDDPISFTKFLTSLNPAQKRKLADININVEVPMNDFPSWYDALSEKYIKMLRGLTTLHLCIEIIYGAVYSWHPAFNPETPSKDYVYSHLAPIMRLEALPLKKVTVIVNDNATARELVTNIPWTRVAKLAFAETLKANLLADHTVEIQRKAKEAREKRERDLAARPSEAKRVRAYARWRSQLAAETQRRSELREAKVEASQGKADKLAAKANETKSVKSKVMVKRAKEKLNDTVTEIQYLQDKAKTFRKEADEVKVNPSLARGTRIPYEHFSDKSDVE